MAEAELLLDINQLFTNKSTVMANFKKSSSKKATVKRAYTKRSVKPSTSGKAIFEIKDGIPETVRVRHHSDEWHMMRNTLQTLQPKKQHAVIDKKYRNRIIAMARKEFPQMEVRSTLSGDKRNALVWRNK